MKNLFTVTVIILSVLLSLFFSHTAHAAVLSFNLDTKAVKTGETVTATIFLDTEGQSINTVEGDVQYDDNILSAEGINIGSSFISFWVEKPDRKTPGAIHFSGIVPGGISARQAEIFRVLFRAKKSGNADLALANLHTFINDGQGTKTTANSTNASITVTVGGNGVRNDILSTDKNPPENFSITRAKDPSVFDNKWFIVFSTIDKESGVDHYEVCEYWRCVTGESPFLLTYQNPFYHIVVRAYDANGNIRESAVVSPWLILLLAVTILGIIHLLYRYSRFFKL